MLLLRNIGYGIYGVYSYLFNGIFDEFFKAIYYNIFWISNQVFDGTFYGILKAIYHNKYNKNELFK